MVTDPRAVHWPKRDVSQASCLAVTPLTNPAVLISHCTANDVSASCGVQRKDMLRHLAKQRRPDSPGRRWTQLPRGDSRGHIRHALGA